MQIHSKTRDGHEQSHYPDFMASIALKVSKAIPSYIVVIAAIITGSYFLQVLPDGAAMTQVQSGLKAGYSFSEGTGATTSDVSGNGNTGTLLGGAAWNTTGKYGNAISFNGTNAVVRVPDSPTWKVNGLSTYTMSLWIKVKSVAGDYKVALGSGVWPSNNFYIYKVSNKWQFGMRTSGMACGYETSALSYLTSADNAYHHIALVLDIPNGTCKLFSDGQVAGEDNYVSGTTSFLSGSNDVNMYIGGLGSGQYLNADIDDVRVYTRALTQTEIQTDMSTPVGGSSPSDTTPPVISAVMSSNITATGARISWSTSEPADSRVEYGTAIPYDQTSVLDLSLVSSHSQSIDGLSSNTQYHYRVHSRDASGNASLSSDFTFTTAPDNSPPVISNVSSSNVTSSSATILWNTDEPADSRIEYGITDSYGTFSIPDPALVTSHGIALTGLSYNTLYHYRVHSRDAAGNPAVSGDFSFTTQPLSTGFREILVAGGLNTPTAMEFSPDGRLFVAEKSGSLRIIQNGQLLQTPFYTATVATLGEQGLFGIAFDPNFGVNKYVYIHYTANTPSVHNRVSRLTANGNTAIPGSEVVILDLPGYGTGGYHRGGAIHFGVDGKLYIAVGDHQEPANAQLLDNPFGKILRISTDGSIPTDNPFISQTSGINRAIYAIGLRNPYTFAIDPSTGRIFANDVGNAEWEEVNLIVAGGNYGWPTCEGPQLSGTGSCTSSSFIYPLHAYPHNGGGGAITGGVFYNGNQFPMQYAGDYFFGDYILGGIRFLDSSNQVQGMNNPSSSFVSSDSPVDLKVGPDGSLYVLLILGNEVHKIQYASGNLNPVAAISATPANGLPPLQVALSAGGSFDPDGDPLTFIWDFGDGSPPAGGAEVAHIYQASGVYTARLTVEDGRGGAGTATIKISIGSLPVAVINTPSNLSNYNAGDIITFSGAATDAEDGTLPASALSWTVVFHHDAHTHPFLGPIDGVTGGTFQIPQVGEADPNVWYRIHLTATDSSGLQHSVYHDVIPNKVMLTFGANYTGLTLTLDGQPYPAPISVESVVGISRSIGTASPQTVGTNQYYFSAWSDGGAITHNIITPPTNATYTAAFQEVPPGPVTTAWFYPRAQAPVTSNSGDQNGFEGSPANLLADDGLFATDTNSGTNTNTSCTNSGKDRQVVSDFSLALPLGKNIVTGLEVRLDGMADSVNNSPKFCVQLSSNGGGSWTSAKSTSVLSTTERTYILGGPADLWGMTRWTAIQLNNANFRVRITSVASSTARDFSLDVVGLRVTVQ